MASYEHITDPALHFPSAARKLGNYVSS